MLLLTSDTAPAPVLSARDHLEGGFAYELAGVTGKAIAAYEAALAAGADARERAEARLRLARVHRSLSEWPEALREAEEAVRLAEEAGSDDLAAEAMNAEVGVHQLRGDFAAGDVGLRRRTDEELEIGGRRARQR